MKIAGTEEKFEVKFLHFDHKTQRWEAECMIGELQVILLGAVGKNGWVVKDLLKVKVSKHLGDHLANLTRNAMADYHELKAYKKAAGEYPAGVIQ